MSTDDVPDRVWVQRIVNVHQSARVYEALGLDDRCRADMALFRDLLVAAPKPAFVEALRVLGYDEHGRKVRRLCINCRASPAGDEMIGVTPSGHVFSSDACDGCQTRVDTEIERIRKLPR